MFYVHSCDITCTHIDYRQETSAFKSKILIYIKEKPGRFVFKLSKRYYYMGYV